jgi:hypothetical protein
MKNGEVEENMRGDLKTDMKGREEHVTTRGESS